MRLHCCGLNNLTLIRGTTSDLDSSVMVSEVPGALVVPGMLGIPDEATLTSNVAPFILLSEVMGTDC